MLSLRLLLLIVTNPESYDLRFLPNILTLTNMKARVTMKGQITIPKELREKFGIEPGSQVDFIAGIDGIRLRKVIDRTKRPAILGCLRKELAGRSVNELLDDLRGQVELPPARRKEKRV